MTKRTLYTLLFMGLMLALSTLTSAQEIGTSERSRIVENFKGKPFYIHFVKDGQTLFGIAKIYGVSSDDLIANNPELKDGLKTDMILKVPFKDSSVVEEKKKPGPVSKKIDTVVESQPAKPVNQITYEIKRGETLYGIAKRYDVSMDAILNANPGINSFRAGSKIYIPVLNQESVIISTPSPITKPTKTVKTEVTKPKPAEVKVADTKTTVANNGIFENPSKNTSGQYKVAMLIPFCLEDMDSIKNDQSDPKSFAFVQFYESALMAVDSLRKQGMDVKLYVYDADRDEDVDKTRAILQKREMADMDLIIGPFYARCFEMASKYAGSHRIPIVNPLSKRPEITTGKPWVFKVQPGAVEEMKELAGFVNTHFGFSNIVLVRPDRLKTPEEAAGFKAEMQLLYKKDNKSTILRECFYTAEGIAGLSLKLATEKPNILVVMSGDEVFVSGLLRNLDQVSGNFDLTVIGSAAWEQYKLDINSMMHLKLHVYSNKYVDFSNPAVKDFSTKFFRQYNTLPQIKDYGFDGFDITYYFLSSLMKNGRQFGRQSEAFKYQGLQNYFHFHKLDGGGYENMGVIFYKFENNNLTRVQ